MKADQTTKEIYAQKLLRYHKFQAAIRQGFAAPEHPEYLELKLWLRDNFRSDFVELF